MSGNEALAQDAAALHGLSYVIDPRYIRKDRLAAVMSILRAEDWTAAVTKAARKPAKAA
jgi:hypothetical protein